MRSCSSKIVMRLEKAQFLSILFLLRTITGLGTNHSFTSCTSISNHSTCYINSILYKNDSSIICNPMYSNCTIQCNLNGCNKPIHCPSNICSNCIVNVINISQPIRPGHIEGYNCQLLQINFDYTPIIYSMQHTIIHAPGNGGNLIIAPTNNYGNKTGYFTNCSIYSSHNGLGTANIIINGSGANNFIDGTYITGDFNVTSWFGEGTVIKCGKKCNINCLPDPDVDWGSGGDGCRKMTVYGINGTHNINWYCDPNTLRECYGAKILCNNYTNPNYSNWKWSRLGIWYLSGSDCDKWSDKKYISCTSISNDNTTCYINATNPGLPIICNPQYPNCIINCLPPTNKLVIFFMKLNKNSMMTGCWGALYNHNIPTPALMYCPSNTCSNCIINGNAFLYARMILGFNCKLLEINDVSIIEKGNIIIAPGNGGNLIINSYSDTSLGYLDEPPYEWELTLIISNQYAAGTGNMIFNGGLTNVYIDGSNVKGDLNFSCVESQVCSGTKIRCNEQCNIICSSDYIWGGCHSVFVYGVNGTSNVNWYCRSDMPRECDGSHLFCGSWSNRTYSAWKWDGTIWYLKTPNCVQNFVIPLLSCTVTTDDTCIIFRGSNDYSRNILCNDQYPNCEIRAAGSIQDTFQDINTVPLDYYCPPKTCDSCIISCDEENSCTKATIWGYQCKTLEINIKSKHNSMTIYAPGNDGELTIFVHWTQELPYFERNNIYSMQGTKNMIFNFKNCYDCSDNMINGSFVTQNLTMVCDGIANCRESNIICPNDAKCNIHCSSIREQSGDILTGGTCGMMIVKAIEGTHDVDWYCNNEFRWTCFSAALECYNGITWWEYNKTQSKWYWSNSNCVNPPSRSPTPAPTEETQSPTYTPSKAPTTTPTAAPTSYPLYFYEKIGFTNEQHYYGTIIASIIGFLLFSGGLIWCIYYYKHTKPMKNRNKKSKYITNACVILITIRDYDELDEIEDEIEINGYLKDLDGIEYDAHNMKELFYDELNYDIFPIFEDLPKMRWTEMDLKTFLE
eukprot:493083_1